MEKWLVDWLRQLKLVDLETVPLSSKASKELLSTLAASRQPPAAPLPDVHIIRRATGLPFMASPAFSVPAGQIIPEGIYITEAYFDRMNDKEREFVINHESGHSHGRHRAKKDQFIRDNSAGQLFLNESRKLECEADHAAAYHMKDSPDKLAEHLKNLLLKGRGRLLERVPEDSEHPSDPDRIANISNPLLKLYPPGSITFDRRCNIMRIESSGTLDPGWTPEVKPESDPSRKR